MTVNEPTREQVLTEWIAALRSDEFEQGTSYLCTRSVLRTQGQEATVGERHCCLGVLCEVGVRHGLLTKTWEGLSAVFTWPGGDSREDLLPIEFAEWLGVKQDPWLGSEHATTLNDSQRYRFTEIASLAEGQYTGVVPEEEVNEDPLVD